MQRIPKLIQRTICRTGGVNNRLGGWLSSSASSRRISPVIIRNFASSRTAYSAKHAASKFFGKTYGSAFAKGATFSFGTLLCAGFLGYGNNPKDTKDMKELKNKMEAIRKNYPNIRNFPVIYSFFNTNN